MPSWPSSTRQDRLWCTQPILAAAEMTTAVAASPSTARATLTSRGWTDSTDFPTMNPLQPANGGGVDVFVTQLNAAGSSLVYSTYLGGSGTENGVGIAVDSSATLRDGKHQLNQLSHDESLAASQRRRGRRFRDEAQPHGICIRFIPPILAAAGVTLPWHRRGQFGQRLCHRTDLLN